MNAQSDERLAAWRSHRQGLGGSLDGHAAADVLSRSGWARSVAGCGPYLTLHTRAGLRREDADAALAKLEIHELPAARGCTYVVPAADYGLALTASQPFADDELKVARRLGVTGAEIEKLNAAVVRALAREALEPDARKAAVGDASRGLGAEGVKKGLSTTLPVALGILQSEGKIRRIPVNGRLDQQRYRYGLWNQTAGESFTELACRYFSWIGPSSLAHFQKFSGLGVKAAKTAIEPLGLIALDDDLVLLPEDEAAWKKFRPPAKPSYTLVSLLDSIALLAGDLPVRGNPRDFPGHLILDRGTIVGRWEFDTESGTIASIAFVPRDRTLENAVRKMEAFVREDLGDARGFSLDSPKSRAPRIAALRKAASAS